MFRYRAFGLDFDSDLAIPQLSLWEGSAAAPQSRVTLRLGNVPDDMVSMPEFRRWQLRDLFRYEIAEGRTITMDPFPRADPRDVADMIMSRLLPITVYQRGLLALHASAVVIGGSVVAFAGPSGAGKSTLAAVLAARGHAIVSDDMLVAVAGRAGMVWPTTARIKLSASALEHLGERRKDLPLANTEEEKFLVGSLCADEDLWRDALPLRALFRLQEGPLSVTPMRALDALASGREFVRSTDLMAIVASPQSIWQQWLALAGATPLWTIGCPRDLAQLAATAELVERTVAAIESPAASNRT